LAGIPFLYSSDLVGLLADAEEQVSPLETLILDNTHVDDDAAAYISACPMLRSLEIAGTKMTSMSLILYDVMLTFSRRRAFQYH
jgi:hypothetical protein